MEIGCSMLAGASLVALGCASVMAEVTGALRSPEATTTHSRQTTSATDSNSAADAADTWASWLPHGCSPI
jgi:hypothetical protein